MISKPAPVGKNVHKHNDVVLLQVGVGEIALDDV